MRYFDSNSLAENTGRVATFILETAPKLNKKDRKTKEPAQYVTGQIVKRSRLVGRLMTKSRFTKIMDAALEARERQAGFLSDEYRRASAVHGENSEQALVARDTANRFIAKLEKKSDPRFEFTKTAGVVRSASTGELQWAIDPTKARRVSEFFLAGTDIKATPELVGDILPVPNTNIPPILTVNRKTVVNSILPE